MSDGFTQFGDSLRWRISKWALCPGSQCSGRQASPRVVREESILGRAESKATLRQCSPLLTLKLRREPKRIHASIRDRCRRTPRRSRPSRSDIGHDCFRSRTRQNVALGDQQLVSSEDRVARDTKAGRHCSRGRQLRAGRDASIQDRTSQLLIQRLLDRPLAAGRQHHVERKYWLHEFRRNWPYRGTRLRLALASIPEAPDCRRCCLAGRCHALLYL